MSLSYNDLFALPGIDLLAVVRRALTLVEGRARRQKVVLTADLPPGAIKLQLDGEQIH